MQAALPFPWTVITSQPQIDTFSFIGNFIYINNINSCLPVDNNFLLPHLPMQVPLIFSLNCNHPFFPPPLFCIYLPFSLSLSLPVLILFYNCYRSFFPLVLSFSLSICLCMYMSLYPLSVLLSSSSYCVGRLKLWSLLLEFSVGDIFCFYIYSIVVINLFDPSL